MILSKQSKIQKARFLQSKRLKKQFDQNHLLQLQNCSRLRLTVLALLHARLCRLPSSFMKVFRLVKIMSVLLLICVPTLSAFQKQLLLMFVTGFQKIILQNCRLSLFIMLLENLLKMPMKVFALHIQLIHQRV